MANEVERSNGMKVELGSRTFYPAGDNVYITDAVDGIVLVAVKHDGKPWDSKVVDEKGKKLMVKRGADMVEKLPSQVFASTKGAVKLNAANQMLSVNLYIPANYGKVEKAQHETATLEQAFGKSTANPLHVK